MTDDRVTPTTTPEERWRLLVVQAHQAIHQARYLRAQAQAAREVRPATRAVEAADPG